MDFSKKGSLAATVGGRAGVVLVEDGGDEGGESWAWKLGCSWAGGRGRHGLRQSDGAASG